MLVTGLSLLENLWETITSPVVAIKCHLPYPVLVIYNKSSQQLISTENKFKCYILYKYNYIKLYYLNDIN